MTDDEQEWYEVINEKLDYYKNVLEPESTFEMALDDLEYLLLIRERVMLLVHITKQSILKSIKEQTK